MELEGVGGGAQRKRVERREKRREAAGEWVVADTGREEKKRGTHERRAARL
jgi:hypothetical protein